MPMQSWTIFHLYIFSSSPDRNIAPVIWDNILHVSILSSPSMTLLMWSETIFYMYRYCLLLLWHCSCDLRKYSICIDIVFSYDIAPVIWDNILHVPILSSPPMTLLLWSEKIFYMYRYCLFLWYCSCDLRQYSTCIDIVLSYDIAPVIWDNILHVSILSSPMILLLWSETIFYMFRYCLLLWYCSCDLRQYSTCIDIVFSYDIAPVIWDNILHVSILSSHPMTLLLW